MINIGLIEDNVELLKNYTEYFLYQEDYNVSFSCSSIDEFLKTQHTFKINPKIILLDINMPGISGIEGIPYLKKKFTEVIIVMLTAYGKKEFIHKALDYGANGYLIKGISLHEIKKSLGNYNSAGSAVSPQVAKELIDVFRLTKEKKELNIKLLTKREKDVAKCITNGLSLKETGLKLGIQYSTINHHLKNIYIKLQVNSKGALTKKIMSITYV